MVSDLASLHMPLLVITKCSWLSASLDYAPNLLDSAIRLDINDPDAPPEERIRLECTKVAIIKATTLHRLSTSAPIPNDIVANFRTRLSQHHSQLPEWMSLGALMRYDSGDLIAQFRPVIFYVHLFYLSALMLLSRRLSIAYIAPSAIGKIVLSKEVRLASKKATWLLRQQRA